MYALSLQSLCGSNVDTRNQMKSKKAMGSLDKPSSWVTALTISSNSPKSSAAKPPNPQAAMESVETWQDLGDLGRKEDTEIQKLTWEKDGKGKARAQNPNLIPFSGWILEGVVWGVKVSHDISVRSSLALGVVVAGEQIQYT